MEDCAVGAAFVIPEFNNLTHSRSVRLHRGDASYLDGPTTHQRDTSRPPPLHHCHLQRLQGGAGSRQVRFSKRSGGSCA